MGIWMVVFRDILEFDRFKPYSSIMRIKDGIGQR